MTITKCEVLKINTNEIWSFSQEIHPGSDLYNQLQNSEDPTNLGFVFERLWEPPVQEKNDFENL